MSGFNIRNKGLRDAFTTMLADNKVTKAEVQTLIDQAQKDGVISGREKADLKSMLSKVGDKFDADAKQKLGDFLGVSTPSTGGGTTTGGTTGTTGGTTGGTGGTTGGTGGATGGTGGTTGGTNTNMTEGYVISAASNLDRALGERGLH